MAVAQEPIKILRPEELDPAPKGKLPSGDRRVSVVWLRDHMLVPMVVLQNDHLGTDACKPN